ncbi:MAG: Helix-turn-helix protein [Verrucomicrobiales bacterium]|nr:Helix-turn-helix protein [Verrucomicrobiales bacterium]
MSYLSTTLAHVADRHALRQLDIAERSGISKGFMSRVFSGETFDLSDKNFVSILKAFAADPKAQAELIVARCMDATQCARAEKIPGAELVHIGIKHGAKAENVGVELSENVHLSKETERAIAHLRSLCPVNSELEKHLVGYARLFGMK